MNFGFIVLIIVISGFFGSKKPLLGSIIGCIITIAQYFYFQEFLFKSFAISVLIGFSISFVTAYFASFFSSGFKGGNHNTGPSYMGGFGGGRGGAPPGGIIQSDEELESHKRK
jgi:hypothetical protein